MKPRTVVVTLEVVTDAPLAALRDPAHWTQAIRPSVVEAGTFTVAQAQANVIRGK